jgi:hypothetical protein
VDIAAERELLTLSRMRRAFVALKLTMISQAELLILSRPSAATPSFQNRTLSRR